jgi:anti-repressor protein
MNNSENQNKLIKKINCDILNNTEITFVKINNDIYFRGKEVATVLGYSNTNQAIINNIDIDNKSSLKDLLIGVYQIEADKLTPNQLNSIYINRYGLYDLIMKSKLPQAKAFRKWAYELIDRELGFAPKQRTQEQILKDKQEVLQLKLNNIKLYSDVLKHLGGYDDRDKIQCVDMARNVMSNNNNNNKAIELNPEDRETSISLRINELYSNLKASAKLKKKIYNLAGRRMAKAYRNKYDKQPIQRIQHVDGTGRKVNHYQLKHFIEFGDEIINDILNEYDLI